MPFSSYDGRSNEEILAIMQEAQRTLWEASLELENWLGFDIDTTTDFEGMTIEDVIDQFKPPYEET